MSKGAVKEREKENGREEVLGQLSDEGETVWEESSHYQEHSIHARCSSGRRASVTMIEMEPFEVKKRSIF